MTKKTLSTAIGEAIVHISKLQNRINEMEDDTARLNFAIKKGWLRRSRAAIDKAMKNE